MSVLETVTVDNVTYDIHDPKVGSGTLQTTAQTLIPAVNELKTGVAKTDVIGSGSLNTTNQTLIGAVNELASNVTANTPKSYYSTYTGTLSGSSVTKCPITFTTGNRPTIAIAEATNSTGYTDRIRISYPSYGLRAHCLDGSFSESSNTSSTTSGGDTVTGDLGRTRTTVNLAPNTTYTFAITDAFIANADTVHTLSVLVL